MADYIASSQQEIQAMLQELGKQNLNDLFSHLPEEVLLKQDLALPEGKSEFETARLISAMAEKNTIFPIIYRGAGAYRHAVPSAVRHLSSRSEFVTAYTPYQAEMSQGLLQAIFEYQTMISEITGMDASNASVYDGATAAAEAMLMCREGKKNRIYIASTANPQVIEVMTTYCHSFGLAYEMIPEKDGVLDLETLETSFKEDAAAVYFMQPNYYGNLEDAEKICAAAHAHKAKAIMGVYPFAMALLPSCKEVGADIAVGEGQPLGMPLAFGGPYLGFMTCTQALTRKLPGRIVGETVDIEGKRAYVLTLQAREQHIRREKASSSICSNQALCALTASIYLAAMGPEGFHEVALQSVSHAHYFAEQLQNSGLFALKFDKEYFNEFVTVSELDSDEVLNALENQGILGGLKLNDHEILWCCTELNRKAELDHTVQMLKEVFA